MTMNPHAPAVTWAARLLGRFHVTGVFWYQVPFYGVRILPRWTDYVTVHLFTLFFFLTLGRIRHAIAANLDPVLGPAGPFTRLARAYRTMLAFAWGLPERYRGYFNPHWLRHSVEGEEHWREVMKSGNGVVLVSAHIGNWELSAQAGADAEKRRVHVIREKEMDPRAQELMRQILEKAGSDTVTHYAGEDASLAFELAEALRNGEIVAFQADRPRAGGRAVTATMFGKPMPLPVGPAALARAAGVPILPVFCFRSGRYRSHIVVRPAIAVAQTRNREADVADAVHHIANEIENAIRRDPHQWFCFRQLW